VQPRPRNSTRISLDWLVAGSVILVLVGLVQFCASAWIAMAYYPGGVRGGPWPGLDAGGYSWSHNYLSDLGRTRAWGGADNSLSSRHFNRGVIILGVTLLVFFLAPLRCSSDWSETPSLAMAFFGAVSSVGLMGIGLAPWDVAARMHEVMLITWVGPLPILCIAFAIQCRCSDYAGCRIVEVVAGAVALALVAAIVAYAGANTFQTPLAQKSFTVVAVAWFLLVAARVALSAIVVTSEHAAREQHVIDQYLRDFEKHASRSRVRPRATWLPVDR
jgi:hypothetical membrane protein